MKNKKVDIIFIILCIILIIGIIYIWNSNMGKSSKQVKETINFLHKLYDIGAIESNTLPEAKDIQEIKVSSNGNSTVAYTLKWNNCGVDLDKDYNVIGFLEQTTLEHGKSALDEKKCISYAEEYLKKIINEKFQLKDVIKDENNTEPYYAINFYRYHGKYINYDDVVTLKIDKYSGKLVAYSGLDISKVNFNSFIKVKPEEAKTISKEYLKTLSLSGRIYGDISLGYFNTEENESTLSYILKYKISAGENKGKICTIIVNGRDGSVIRHSIQQ